MGFRIGDYVRFCVSYFTTDADTGNRVLSQVKSEPGRGIIVGACYKHEGIRHAGSSNFNGESNEYEDSWFESTNRVFFYKIREGMINQEVIALPEDIVSIEPFKIPKLKTHQPEWTEAIRKVISEECKNWPRDEKGRWTK